MPPAKKGTAKKTKKATKKVAKKSHVHVEEGNGEHEGTDPWDVWESRVKSIAIEVVGIVMAVHEIFFVKTPRESALVFIASVIGLPPVIAAAKRGTK